MQKKTFGDKVHQFLRRIGIKETQTLNVADLYARIEDLAKSKEQTYISLEIEISTLNGVELIGYIHGNPAGLARAKTADEVMEKLILGYTVGSKKSPIKEIII